MHSRTLKERIGRVRDGQTKLMSRAQLEQSRNRLCLNLNRQRKEPLQAPSEPPQATPAPASRGYRVSEVIRRVWKSFQIDHEKSTPAPAPVPAPAPAPHHVPAPHHNLNEIRKSQNQNPPVSRPAQLPSLTPLSSASTTPASNVTPNTSRGPSLSVDVHMRPSASKLVFPENRNSFNRNNVDMEKEFAKINAKLDSLESRYDTILKKLDYLIQISERKFFVCSYYNLLTNKFIFDGLICNISRNISSIRNYRYSLCPANCIFGCNKYALFIIIYVDMRSMCSLLAYYLSSALIGLSPVSFCDKTYLLAFKFMVESKNNLN